MASPNPFYFKVGSTVKAVEDLTSTEYDGVILVTLPDSYNLKTSPLIQNRVDSALLLDKGLKTEVAVISCPEISGSRLVISPTGPITPYDDVRSLYEAAKNGVKRAIKAGVLNPILVIQNVPGFKDSELLTLLGALEGLYVPLQVRDSGKLVKINNLGVYGSGSKNISDIIETALYLEEARTVTRDIGGGDPERMCPPNVETYVRHAFHQSKNIQLKVESDVSYLEKKYPLFAAVNRAANEIERHRGRVIFLEYAPADTSKVTDTVLLVGKGVTYDTGGADIKAGGVMAGMSRDKCGAAAVAGFMKACETLRPPHLRVVGVMSMVRNSVGENSYVADELIVARSGVRVRVGNTDAEGRMIMADLLCLMRDRARSEVNPHIYSVATLTGHAIRAMGEGYGIVIDNHAARLEGHGARLQASGERMADPFEISSLRREDLKAHRGTFEGDDALQANNEPSVNTERGHQNPAGFLLIASGLEGETIKYSHLDVAGSAGIAPAEPTASPLLALARHYNLIA